MTIDPPILAGEWDVYSNGVHSVLSLNPAGTFTHMLWGGVQGYWGHWSIQQAPQGSVIQFNVAGAQPQVYYGPNGPMQMQWPTQENWLITGFAQNQITTTDSVLVRKIPMPFAPLGFPAPASQFQPQFQPAPQAFPAPQPAPPQTASQPAPQNAAPLHTQAAAQPQPAHPAPQPADPLAAARQAEAAAANAAQIQQIYASIAQHQALTTMSINSQWADVHNQQIAAIQVQNFNTVNQTHAMAKAWTAYAAS